MIEGTHVVEGYVLCPRPHDEPKLVREDVAWCTGGLCLEHFHAEGSKRIERIELVRRGQRLSVPARVKPVKRKRHRPERNARKNLNAKARERARKRVADLFPELYVILLAEEREALGLPALPVQVAVQGGDPTAAIEYAEREAGLR